MAGISSVRRARRWLVVFTYWNLLTTWLMALATLRMLLEAQGIFDYVRGRQSLAVYITQKEKIKDQFMVDSEYLELKQVRDIEVSDINKHVRTRDTTQRSSIDHYDKESVVLRKLSPQMNKDKHIKQFSSRGNLKEYNEQRIDSSYTKSRFGNHGNIRYTNMYEILTNSHSNIDELEKERVSNNQLYKKFKEEELESFKNSGLRQINDYKGVINKGQKYSSFVKKKSINQRFIHRHNHDRLQDRIQRYLNNTLKSERILRTSYGQSDLAVTQNDQWRQISPGIFLYSAYHDDRPSVGSNPLIRIFGKSLVTLQYVQCFIHYRLIIKSVWAQVTPLMPTSDSFVITCKVEISWTPLKPTHVAIKTDNRTSGNLQWIPVHLQRRPVRNGHYVFGACVQPFYGFYNNSLKLVQFIAFYYTVGVTHFTFYDMETSPDILSLLRWIQAITPGLSIEVLNWEILWTRDKSQVIQVQTAQMTQIQDCLYRSMDYLDFVVVADVDEYIVPRNHFSLHELIQELSMVKGGPWGSFVFLHTVFPLNQSLPKISKELFTLSATFRGEIWTRLHRRSKYIVRLDSLVRGGIHSALTLFEGWQKQIVNSSSALLNHYRAGLNVSVTVQDTVLPSRYGLHILRHIFKWFK